MSKEVGIPRYLSLVVPLKKVGDEAVHKELGDRMERATTTASSLEPEQDSVNPIIYTSCIEQFWVIAKVQTVNEVHQLQALVDKKKVIIMETSIRSDLHLDDAEGTECLPTATIFEELARMSSTMASLIICLATNQKFNLSKYILDDMVKHLDGGVKFLMYPRFLQVFINQQLGDMSHHKKIFVNPFHTKKVFANMKRAGKDFSRRITPLFDTMKVQASEEVGEDSDHPTDSNQIPIVLDLEKAKDAQAKKIAASKKRVQKLERKKTSRTTGLQRLKKVDIDADVEITLVDETQERQDEDLITAGEAVTIAGIEDSAAAVTTAVIENSAAPIIPTTVEETLAQTLMEIKAAKPKAKGIVFHDQEEQVSVSKPTVSVIQPLVKDKIKESWRLNFRRRKACKGNKKKKGQYSIGLSYGNRSLFLLVEKRYTPHNNNNFLYAKQDIQSDYLIKDVLSTCLSLWKSSHRVDIRFFRMLLTVLSCYDLLKAKILEDVQMMNI
ncbi:hypothetical protein Tco_0651764 [Tanacetum coccineum]|uniref:Uncharacterized protein n=1 Tax=Tanacetum coccineum TaxID=301880 RepID=A0ABQ4WWB1_9ASTR